MQWQPQLVLYYENSSFLFSFSFLCEGGVGGLTLSLLNDLGIWKCQLLEFCLICGFG